MIRVMDENTTHIEYRHTPEKPAPGVKLPLIGKHRQTHKLIHNGATLFSPSPSLLPFYKAQHIKLKNHYAYAA